jgi:hypothetical protein
MINIENCARDLFCEADTTLSNAENTHQDQDNGGWVCSLRVSTARRRTSQGSTLGNLAIASRSSNAIVLRT